MPQCGDCGTTFPLLSEERTICQMCLSLADLSSIEQDVQRASHVSRVILCSMLTTFSYLAETTVRIMRARVQAFVRAYMSIMCAALG